MSICETNKSNKSLGNENKKEYTVGGICMVAQTSNFLQFHTAHISQTLGSTLTVRYLNNSESDNFNRASSPVIESDREGYQKETL